MDEAINAIECNNMWELSNLPKGARPVGVKWVRYKARLITKGYK